MIALGELSNTRFSDRSANSRVRTSLFSSSTCRWISFSPRSALANARKSRQKSSPVAKMARREYTSSIMGVSGFKLCSSERLLSRLFSTVDTRRAFSVRIRSIRSRE